MDDPPVGNLRGGHHWVPEEYVKKHSNRLTPAAKKVFLKTVTNKNQTFDAHRRKRYGPIHHDEYNELVIMLTNDHIDGLAEQGKLGRSGKLSRVQAEEWLRRIVRDGAGNRKVYEFNQAVLKHLQVLGLVSAIAGALVTDFAKAADVAARSSNYRRAIEHLQRGELHSANVRLNGDADSFYTDLIDANLLRPALLFRLWWPKAVERALNQRVQF